MGSSMASLLRTLSRSNALQAVALRNQASARALPAATVAVVPRLQQRWYAAPTLLAEEDVVDRVLGCVKNFQKVDPTKVTRDSHFLNDLGLDSLDTVEVVMAFEDEFIIEIPDADAEKILTCADAITYVMKHPAAK